MCDCSVVAVSDAHERTISTDLLLGLLKKVQRVRHDLRVVIITTPPTAATFRSVPLHACHRARLSVELTRNDGQVLI